ncbi:modification methylase [Treponema vincentii]|uniref:adenine-specific methyltransferase EcoRI family protein n=1 Tax=Treponema vincentii TaxID=69710 RepID=UPI0020A43293|nr:adenine-specific methyltransferase EcoRI family protein [Treponema vincentii]UTC47125.1 modification methylase [Treponema vincentii]
MANKNTNLHKAKRFKDDEFYTTYETVENELSHYIDQFKNKTVLCNCDNPFTSNFSKYFIQNFNLLGLRRFICTSFSSPNLEQPRLFDTINPTTPKGFVLDVSKVNGFNKFDNSFSDFLASTNSVKELEGNGDFRSAECISYLKECDIVVTNPPFSLFKEMVFEVMKYDKKFLIIGNQNALTYKEIFPLVQNNIVWTGYQFGEMKFRVPQASEPRSTRYWVDETGQKWRSLGNAMWLTNLDNERRHENLRLTKRFNPIIHKKYDNYDAIHVRNITEIPFDYRGIMGVPITIINRYNSDQFEIVGEANHGSDSQYDIFKPILNGKEVFKRILIRNKAIAI